MGPGYLRARKHGEGQIRVTHVTVRHVRRRSRWRARRARRVCVSCHAVIVREHDLLSSGPNRARARGGAETRGKEARSGERVQNTPTRRRGGAAMGDMCWKRAAAAATTHGREIVRKKKSDLQHLEIEVEQVSNGTSIMEDGNDDCLARTTHQTLETTKCV